MNKEDLKFLMEITSVQSSSTVDTDIMNYIKNYIVKLSLEYTEDDFGNIYVTKGEGKNGYKCLVSHTDTVHSLYEYRKVFYDNDHIFAMGYNKNEIMTQVGIGGDDRVGNYMCLKGLQDFDDIKVVFFRFEETGCKGSKACNMDFFKDCNFVIEPDRKGYGDFIRNSCGTEMCSDEFVETMRSIFTEYSYSVVAGVSTDVDKLKSRGLEVSCINLGCGYYYPHSNKEVLHVPDVQACYELITEMFNKHGETRFPHTYVPYVYKSSTYTSHIGRSYNKQGTIFNRFDDTFQFSNKSKDNYFEKALELEIYNKQNQSKHEFMRKLTKDKYRDFNELIGGYFSINNNIPIYVYKQAQVVYLPNEDKFYDINGNVYIEDLTILKQMYKDMTVLDGDTAFVFSELCSSWVKRSDSYWDKSYHSWDLKDMIEE